MRKIHLICNAHLDPVWLWEWQEGLAEAISTFRIAAEFCEADDGFIFDHNEVILYQWVEEYEPSLFKRIQELVALKKWHIMGGWYLQPDCNMSSGESLVRQILEGKIYFKKKFRVEPTTAINFDPFGHSRGLVQILVKSGYDSYLFCRPLKSRYQMESEEFTWVGFDGSEILAHRAYDGYLTYRGEARNKVEKWMKDFEHKPVGMILWGIGNHGGGPSKIDLKQLNELIKGSTECEIRHSTPEQYFKDLKKSGMLLPRFEKDLNPWAIGTYTSMTRIKQKHRLLENELFMTEKMLSSASVQGYLEYPEQAIMEAQKDLLFSEFHDILPGSSIQPVEEFAMNMMGHALHILSQLKAKAFFALASGQPNANEGEIPILIYNPHPHKVKGIFTCEFSLADQNFNTNVFMLPEVYNDGKKLPSQVEKEVSNMSVDWRKYIAFEAELEPSQMNRFDCRLIPVESKPKPKLKPEENKIKFDNGRLKVEIDCSTGLMDKYEIDGVDYIRSGAFLPVVVKDNEHSLATYTSDFKETIGKFELLSKEAGTRFSGTRGELLESVRIIEDGEVRTVVEAVMGYGDSFLCQTYRLPKLGTEIELEVRVIWNEKDKMLKLSVPTVLRDAKYIGQTAYGYGDLPENGLEAVAQKWVGIVSKEDDRIFACINNGSYGSDYNQGELRLSLLRSPRYGCLFGFTPESVCWAHDRFSPRMDQGERIFKFWFDGGKVQDKLETLDREALVHNEAPYALSFFPSGSGKKPLPFIVLEGDTVSLVTVKQAEETDDFIIRLFEASGMECTAKINIPSLEMEQQLHFGKFEIKTLKLAIGTKQLREADLMEREL